MLDLSGSTSIQEAPESNGDDAGARLRSPSTSRDRNACGRGLHRDEASDLDLRLDDADEVDDEGIATKLELRAPTKRWVTRTVRANSGRGSEGRQRSAQGQARPALSSSAFERFRGLGLRFFRNLSPAVARVLDLAVVCSVFRALALAGA